MCGLVGFITGFKNGFTAPQMKAFQEMLFVDTLRGADSTGVMCVDGHNNVLVHKEASDGLSFIGTKEFGEFKTKAIRNGKFVVGHNRAATRGKVTDENAHPFVVDEKIVLFQNGTYRGCHKHHKDVEVDTEAIAHVIAENEDVSTALKKINAAYALIWYNRSNKKLNIIRNNERPLYIAYTEDGSFMFASEIETILWAAARNNIKLKEGSPYMLKEGCHLTYTLEEGGSARSDFVDIDTKYTFQQHRQDVVPFEGYGGGACLFQKKKFDAHAPLVYTPNSSTKNVKKADKAGTLTVGFPEWVVHNRKEYLVPEEVKKTLTTYVEQMRNNEKEKGYVELIDYVPGNDRADCSIWFVFGALLLSEDPEDKLLVYWIVADKTDIEIIEYITEGIYEVSLSSTRHIGYRNSRGELGWACMCFGMDPLLVTQLTQNEAVSHVH